ncbi:MAG: NAD-dependent epimerase/dehydratase family protein [Dehalococcoidaceae bacterium]|nr:NAD-dependent epimerase/dehydratase family protein [Dehalococcoidaceae bacterium]
MRVLVTGASGHLGANLIRRLIKEGAGVRVLQHQTRRALEGLDIEIYKGDVTDSVSIKPAFKNVDTVFHLAASISIHSGSYRQLERINVAGTRNVVNHCLDSGVSRLVHFSSIHATGKGKLDERLNKNTVDTVIPDYPAYDRSKAMSEFEMYSGLEKGLNAVIIRPTAVLGPYDFQPSYLGRAIIKLVEHKLPALVSGGYDWVDARDVVSGAVTAWQRAKPGSCYLLAGHRATFCELASLLEEITGIAKPRVTCPRWLAYCAAPLLNAGDRLRGSEPLFTSVSIKAMGEKREISCRKASRELGYEPRPLKTTLADTLEWFKHHGMIAASVKINRE